MELINDYSPSETSVTVAEEAITLPGGVSQQLIIGRTDVAVGFRSYPERKLPV